jgi:hypothetical protein
MEEKSLSLRKIFPLAGQTRETSLKNLFRHVEQHPESVIPQSIRQTDKEKLDVTLYVNPFYPNEPSPRDVMVYISYNLYQRNDLYVRNLDGLSISSYIPNEMFDNDQAISLLERLRKT